MGIQLDKHNMLPYENLCRALEEGRRCIYTAAAGTGKELVAAKYIEDHGLVPYALVLCPRPAKEKWARLLPGIHTMTCRQAVGNAFNKYRIVVCDDAGMLEAVSGYDGPVIVLAGESIQSGMGVVTGLSLTEAVGSILPGFVYTSSLAGIMDMVQRYKERANKSEKGKQLLERLETAARDFSIQELLPKHKPGKTVVVCSRPADIDVVSWILRSMYPEQEHLVCKKYTDLKSTQPADNLVLYLPSKYLPYLNAAGVETAILFRSNFSKTDFLQNMGRILSYGEDKVNVYDFISDIRGYQDSLEDFDAAAFAQNAGMEVSDHAKEQLGLINELEQLLSTKWRPEENDLLREYYGGNGWAQEVSKLLPERTVAAIRLQAGKLGLTEGRDRNEWTEEEMEILLQHYKNRGNMKTLLELLPRHTENSIRFKAERTGLSKLSFFTEEEKQMIIDHYDYGRGLDFLEKMLPAHSRHAIIVKAGSLGVSKRITRFTDEEDELIREYYSKKSQKALQEVLQKRSMAAIVSRAKKIGAAKPASRKCFSEEEDALIREYYQQPDGLKKLEGLLPGRNQGSIITRAWYLGLAKSSKNRFTEKEESLIREYYQQPGGIGKLMELLPGHSRNSIQYKACRLGLTKKKPWTEKEDQMLREYYGGKSGKE